MTDSLATSAANFKSNNRCEGCGLELLIGGIDNNKGEVYISCIKSRDEGHTNGWYKLISGKLCRVRKDA